MKKIVLRFWPIIFIIAVWFIFSSPYFLKGKAPFAATYQLNNFAPWDAYPKFWGPVKNGAMPDVITQIYPWRHLAVQIWKEGLVPLWNPYSFAGTPLLANYQSAVLSPFNLLFFILPFVDGWSILVLLQPLLAGIFTYIFVRSLKRSEVASLISAVSFMFCGFITCWMGYATLAFAILFLPLSLFGIEKYYAEKKSRYLMLLSLSIPLSFLSGHFQISLYFAIFLIAYILFKLVTVKDTESFVKTSIFALLGLLISMPQLLPSIELYTRSFRSAIFHKDEVIPWAYLPTFLAPDFFGNPVTRNDWFGHYAEWNSYIGIVPLILAVYSFFTKRKEQIIFLTAAAVLSLLLAFDSKIVDLLIFLHIPVLSTSAASRIIVIYSFSFSVLSAFGFDLLVSDMKEKKTRRLLILLASFLIVFISLWLAIFFKIFIPVNKIAIAKSNLILPTLIFAASIVTIGLTTFNKKLIFIASLIFVALVSFDMLRFAMKWQEFSPKGLVFTKIPTTEAFSKISGFHRVIGNFGAETSVYYNLPSLEGYDALYIDRYGQFIAGVANGTPSHSYRSVVVFSKGSPNAPLIINLLDTKYVVHKLADDHASWTFPFWTYPPGQFKLIYKDSAYEFYQNNNAFPHAFLVGDYKVIKDEQKIIDVLTSKDIDLSKTIVLEEDPKIAKESGDIGGSKIVKYTPNEIDIDIDAKNKSLLFLSDNYYTGWKAYVDGTDTKIYRADYSFRAVVVPQGTHKVKFAYKPPSFTLGIWLAFVGILGLAVKTRFFTKI